MNFRASILFAASSMALACGMPALAETNPVAKMFAGYQRAPNARVPNPLMGADGKAFLEGAFAEIDKRWGSVEGFLKTEVGLTDRDLRALRTAYTE